jgi:hypothetical protein
MALRSLLVIPIIALTALAFVLPAGARPDNKNTGSFEADCEGIGPITVFENIRGNGGGVVFTEDGQVIVAKRISGSGFVEFAVEGGPTFVLPEEFEEGSKGKGFQDRLVSCDFTQTFVDEFIVDEEFAEEFGLDPSFIGATVTVTGEINGTAEVFFPGN